MASSFTTEDSMNILAIAVNHAIIGMTPKIEGTETWKSQLIVASAFLYHMFKNGNHPKECASMIRAIADCIELGDSR